MNNPSRSDSGSLSESSTETLVAHDAPRAVDGSSVPSETDRPQDEAGEESSEHRDSGAYSGNDSALQISSEETANSDDAPLLTGRSQAGRRLGDFRLVRLLGRGGMAEVYLAEQLSLKRQVAVKILREDLLSDSPEMYRQRFEQEAKAAAGLNHPHIVQVYSIGVDGDLHYIAQEYVHGQNLREYLKRSGPADVSLALRVLQQVASALQTAAEAGIVHRDIKPENILLNRKGDVKITDFGLAQLTQGDERVQLTQVGVTMGTPLYMSPEQINGRPLDARSDLYSLGVTCYHLLTGQPPFRGETALSVAVQHLREDPVPLSERRRDLPPALCRVIETMLCKDPDQRYRSAAALLEDVQRVASEMAKSAPWTADRLTKASRSSGFGFPRGWIGPTLRSPGVRSFLWAFVATAGISAAVGWWSRMDDPLQQPVQVGHQIPRQSTAAAQYMLAVRLVDDEQAWLAILENFPEAELECRRAQEQLAMLYLRSRRFEDAKRLFNQFASPAIDDATLRAHGLAGLVVLASLKGDYQESQRILAVDLMPLGISLDGEMARLVREAVVRNQRELGNQVQRDYEELFEPDPDDADSSHFDSL